MLVKTETLVPISEANKNFSKTAKLVDQYGSVVILKNNVPKYVIIEFDRYNKQEEASDEAVLEASKLFLEKNKAAYEELAK